MNLPRPEQFTEFYKAVYGKSDDPTFGPFPWQTRLANRVCNGDWPRAIALPTAAGKTACIDIAVFALACRAKDAPRRIFFVVDRRIVVDQAWMHAKMLAAALDRATQGVLRECADALRDVAEPGWLQLSLNDRQRFLDRRWAIQDEADADKRQKLIRKLTVDERAWYEASPLDVYTLRGGMYRETAWTRSPIQPTVIASTVDQVGSRLLFRAYGVSDSMKPIHAGLVGNDALILLDEAHCAKPFDQTMQGVEKYRAWNESPAPFCFVSVTATPPQEIQEAEQRRKRERSDDLTLIEEAQDEDRKHPVLGKRIAASKPAKLVIAEKAKGKKGTSELVKVLESHARELSKEFACVGVIVNRVKTARELKKKLGEDAVLLTGRMRPLDRDKLFEEKLKPLMSNAEGIPPPFVIGTQCLECGADFDLHGLVVECSSLDALRQRFGRLNRVANRTTAKAVIVIRRDQVERKEKEDECDPVYGNSLPETWEWLHDHVDGKTKDEIPWIDFGVSSIRDKWEATPVENREKVTAPSSDAPLLFPAHLDTWVQTNPIPTPDPEPALFLHGATKPGQPDVQVVFRRDLGPNDKQWADIVCLCPPSSSEAVAVPISLFKKWLAGEAIDDQSGDVEGEADLPEEEEAITRSVLRWRGLERSCIVDNPYQITPNDLYVIPCSAEGAKLLGDFPFDLTDDGEEAFQRSRDKAVLRLMELTLSKDSDDFDRMLTEYIELQLKGNSPDWLRRAVQALTNPKDREEEPHPLGGWVVTGKRRLRQYDPTYLDDSEPSESFQGRAVTLVAHSRGVAEHAKRFARSCGIDLNLYSQSSLWHDIGKLDPRFQAMLKQSSPRTAVGDALAKSARSPRTNRERDDAREVHRYPKGARHELLSTALVATKTEDDLLLHLIATHHGSGRPFADSVKENNAAKTPFKTPDLFGQTFELPTSAQQIAAWNSELPERFWRVVRKYGWWGSAYREAVFRLADHAQSRAEQEKEDKIKDAKPADVKPSAFTPRAGTRPMYPLPLTGLDGANPLAFLAALGSLVVLDRIAQSDDRPDWLPATVALSWQAHTPILHLSGEVPSPEKLSAFLVERCASTLEEHPAKFVVSLFEDKEDRPERLRKFVQDCSVADRAKLEWVVAHFTEIAEDGTSQLLTVRRDYFPDNLRSILSRCKTDHIRRALFQPWDYADALDNQSLHWEPSEDRRHAYQWHMPSGDPTRKKQGGMLGANRLALEAWPFFPLMPVGGERLATRGFKGNRASDTYWTWPLWHQPLTKDAVASILGLPDLQKPGEEMKPVVLQAYGVIDVFRVQRILVGKTPNLTTSLALA